MAINIFLLYALTTVIVLHGAKTGNIDRGIHVILTLHI